MQWILKLSTIYNMCFTLVINRGEYEIQSPRQFNDFFGKNLIKVKSKKYLDYCMCGVNFDIEKYLKEQEIFFQPIGGDIYAEMTPEQLKLLGK